MLERLDLLYQSAIRFATNAPYRTDHCTLYSSVNWSSLYTHHKTHWLMLIYKTLLGLTPPIWDIYCSLILHIQHPFCQSHSAKGPQSTRMPGSLVFQFAAASNWNKMKKKTLKLDKDSIMNTLTGSCGCFVWCIVVSTFLLLSVLNYVCTMFCSSTMLWFYHAVFLPCCVSTMLCFYHVVFLRCCGSAMLWFYLVVVLRCGG